MNNHRCAMRKEEVAYCEDSIVKQQYVKGLGRTMPTSYYDSGAILTGSTPAIPRKMAHLILREEFEVKR